VDSYQLCVESTLLDLNNLNIKYEKALREISSIFDLFQHINLITDYNNLYAIINDMLMGVLGLTDSTIFSVEEDCCLPVEASSISRRKLKHVDEIRKKLAAADCLQGTLAVFDREKITEKISMERGIQSTVALPLMKGSQCLGVIYLEHSLEGYFKEESKQFLSTLAIAIRLAIENAQLYSRLEKMTLRDGLTGLFNQMYFNKEISNCWDVLHKYHTPFIVALIDIDDIQGINEAYGFQAGDAAIMHVGKLLENEIRKGDILCRCGGDQFGIIFRNTPDIKAIRIRLEEMRQRLVHQPLKLENKVLQLSCSFGVAGSSLYGEEPRENMLIYWAEQALQAAKEKGRNRVEVYTKA
jgi:diguanylate cyclase (GGDEF)-like protein